MTPRASILVPAWNEAATIAQCLADVRAQVSALGSARVDWQCVVALDGPGDGTDRIVRDVAAVDSRFVVVAHPGDAHRGLVATLNAGLAACRGEIVVRFDADDRMHPERVVRQVAMLDAHPELAVVTGRVAYEAIGGFGRVPYGALGDVAGADGDGMRRHCDWLNTLTTPAALRAARFVDAPVAHPAVAYRRELVVAAGGYRDGDFAEDHDLWLRLFAAGHAFGMTPSDAPLVTWRDRPARATRADPRYGEEARRALVHRHLIDWIGGRTVRLWGAGKFGRWHGKHLRAAGVTVDAFLDIDPKKVGRVLIGGVPVVAADALGPPGADGGVVLVAVASRGARASIAPRLAAAGWVEDQDWVALQ